jgi:hypothetical protein
MLIALGMALAATVVFFMLVVLVAWLTEGMGGIVLLPFAFIYFFVCALAVLRMPPQWHLPGMVVAELVLCNFFVWGLWKLRRNNEKK